MDSGDRGFNELKVGDTIEAIASTGFGPVTLWAVIQETNGEVSTMTSSEPDFVEIGPGTTVPLKFPPIFPSQKTPDEEFPVGTQLQTIVKAENASGSSIVTSNALTPITGPAPITPVKFGLKSFDIVNQIPQAVGNNINWLSDTYGSLNDVADDQADGVWRQQQYFKDMSSSAYPNPVGFCINKADYNYISYVDFVFEAGEELQNKIIDLMLYMYAAAGSGNMYSTVTTDTAGVSPYSDTDLNIVPSDAFDSCQSFIITDPGVTEINIRWSPRTNQADMGREENQWRMYAFRIRDVANNIYPTEKP